MNAGVAFLRKAVLVCAVGILLAAMAFPALRTTPWRLSYDPQVAACLPWNWYLVHVGERAWRVGDLVVLRQGDLEQAATLEFAGVARKPLQQVPPAVKFVAAAPGDRVAVRDDAIWVNGRYYGRLWLKKWVARNYPDLQRVWPEREIVVPPGKLLVLGTQPLAFDGRYFGLVPESDIRGRAWPI